MKTKTQIYCAVTSRAYNVRKIFNDFSQLPQSAEYYATIYGAAMYDIYLTTAGQYYARLIK
jgi:hypothetical protein